MIIIHPLQFYGVGRDVVLSLIHWITLQDANIALRIITMHFANKYQSISIRNTLLQYYTKYAFIHPLLSCHCVLLGKKILSFFVSNPLILVDLLVINSLKEKNNNSSCKKAHISNKWIRCQDIITRPKRIQWTQIWHIFNSFAYSRTYVLAIVQDSVSR